MMAAELRKAPCRRYQRTTAWRHPPTDKKIIAQKRPFGGRKASNWWDGELDAIRGRGAPAGGPSRDGWRLEQRARTPAPSPSSGSPASADGTASPRRRGRRAGRSPPETPPPRGQSPIRPGTVPANLNFSRLSWQKSSRGRNSAPAPSADGAPASSETAGGGSSAGRPMRTRTGVRRSGWRAAPRRWSAAVRLPRRRSPPPASAGRVVHNPSGAEPPLRVQFRLGIGITRPWLREVLHRTAVQYPVSAADDRRRAPLRSFSRLPHSASSASAATSMLLSSVYMKTSFVDDNGPYPLTPAKAVFLYLPCPEREKVARGRRKSRWGQAKKSGGPTKKSGRPMGSEPARRYRRRGLKARLVERNHHRNNR